MVTSSCEATPGYLETVPHFQSPLLGRHREIGASSGDQFAETASVKLHKVSIQIASYDAGVRVR